MIFVDYSQACIAAIMVMASNPKKIDQDMIRHVVLNMLRSYNVKYGEEYGNIVICCDNKKSWRRDLFPLYKANRAINRNKSPYDWALLFKTIGEIKQELKENIGYRVLDVDGAEADDIIGTLVLDLGPRKVKNLIISSDGDFLQLQHFEGLRQFSPNLNRYIETDNPDRYLKEHIMSGDRGDGIPNFLSPDDSFVSGTRQKPLTQKKLDLWLDMNPVDFCDDVMMARYTRNKMLIDLKLVPDNIKSAILVEFEKEIDEWSYNKVSRYFMDKGLANLFDHIGDFKPWH